MTDNENAANIMLQRLVREVSKLWRGEQSERETAFFAKHDVQVCKEVVKECLQVLRDMRLVYIRGYYSSGWNDCIDRAIERLAEKYYIDVEEVEE